MKRAKQGAREASVAYVRLCVFLELESLVGSGRHSISLHLKVPDCEKIDILNAFFLSEFFQYNDDFYGDFYGDLYGDLYGDFYGDFYGDTFVATNFLISLFLFFPLYDFYLILLASQRAFQRASLAKGGSRSHSPTPPGYAPVHIVSLGCCGLSTDKICGRRSGPHTRQD